MDKIWSAAQYKMQAVVYDLGYDTRIIKTRKNMVTMRLLAAIKKNKLTRYRWPKKYQYLIGYCTCYQVIVSAGFKQVIRFGVPSCFLGVLEEKLNAHFQKSAPDETKILKKVWY